MNRKDIELLAPAGTYECFIAAINAGADAVYLGLDRFSARANAGNLSYEELKEALDIAHINGSKIYLTVNTLLKDSEIDRLYDFLYKPYEWGLDGVIVQDTGVMYEINRLFGDLPIHVSTQAAVTASAGANYLKRLGIRRIVPARELSIREIEKLKKQTGLEIECFIHGSLCYSYSGKCLLSSFIGGRSGNRGRCAQPCRLPYNGQYILSLKDLCVIDMIPELIKAGVSSFKIEGRMKSSEYVYGVTSIYRKYIDRYFDEASYSVDEEDRRILVSYYTRGGNCEGYYKKYNGRSMITYDSPSYSTNTSEAADRDMITRIPRIKVDCRCRIASGQRAEIYFYNDSCHSDTVTDITAEKALKCALSEESVTKQLKRSGGTCFDIRNVTLELDDNVFIPNGKLNEIRRQGLDDFKEAVLSGYRRNPAPDPGRKKASRPGQTDTPGTADVNVSVLDKDQLRAAIMSGADGIIIPMSLFVRECGSGQYDFNGKKIYVSLPYVVREAGRKNSSGSITDFVNKYTALYNITGFYVSNNESVELLAKCGYKGSVTADIHLYTFNNEAWDFYMDNGVTRTTVPVELNEKELYERAIFNEELVIYGRLPVMISANCVINTQKGCMNNDLSNRMHITDRKGEKLFVDCNCSECTNVIYNSKILSISDERQLFERIRPASVRLAFTDEDHRTVTEVIQKYLNNRREDGSTAVRLIDSYTKGHLKRGVD